MKHLSLRITAVTPSAHFLLGEGPHGPLTSFQIGASSETLV